MRTAWKSNWLRFGGLYSQLQNLFQMLATDISQLLGSNLLAIEITGSLLIYVCVRKPQDCEDKRGPHIQGPFSLLNHGNSSFLYIPAMWSLTAATLPQL